MPLREFKCPKCGGKIERFFHGFVKNDPPLCGCGYQMEEVEFSVPAKRDPEKGIQR